MTRQRAFKALVRERMVRTGERYAAARAQLLATRGDPLPSGRYRGILPGYDRFGGIQSNTAPLRNVLRHAGIFSPMTGAPYSEAAVNGLCGGPGFLYAVFQYKGLPPILTLALQSRSMPDVYVAAGLSRLGLRLTQAQTTSAAASRKALDESLEAGRAPLCVVDLASLPWYGLPSEYVGGSPQVVGIAGRDGDAYWIDDRPPQPMRLEAAALANARARFRQGKNRLIRVEGPDPAYDAKRAVRDAVADTARSYTDPAVPKSFQVNCGFSGLNKWRQMLTEEKDKKAWPAVFGEGPLAHAGLHRAYECIEGQFGPGAGRPLYAQFLEESAAAIDRPSLRSAASVFREAGEAWTRLAGLIANCGDEAVRQACEVVDRRLELADGQSGDISDESAGLWARRHRLAADCRLTKDAARALYAEMSGVVGRILDLERTAVAQLRKV